MPTYVVLENWTEQGYKNYREAPFRMDRAAASMEQHGAKIREAFWTMGPYDIVSIIEAPDDATISAILLNDVSRGNVRSVTMRAFTTEEMQEVVKRIPAR